jgi:D-alanine-D-alanine ligase
MTIERWPKIVSITNENPEWPDLDKGYADETWTLLIDGLAEEGYTHRACKFFGDLNCLDGLDPRDWLVWNWGEEWAGVAWSDALVAEEIERRGFAYTGADAATLRRTTSRAWVKTRLQEAGLPTLSWRLVTDEHGAAGWTSFPAIVKGANQHASVGIDREAVVMSTADLAARVSYLRREYGDDAIVEPFLDSREFSVAVWGNDHPEALPPTEIVYPAFDDMRDRLHTQAWKIDRDSRGYHEILLPCPAPIDRPDWRARLEEVSVRAYRALGMRDYARFDLRMLGDEPQVLDANANPELDVHSVVVGGARVMGLSYGQMAGRIIELAARRMPR